MNLISKILLESEEENLFKPRRLEDRSDPEKLLKELLKRLKKYFPNYKTTNIFVITSIKARNLIYDAKLGITYFKGIKNSIKAERIKSISIILNHENKFLLFTNNPEKPEIEKNLTKGDEINEMLKIVLQYIKLD